LANLEENLSSNWEQNSKQTTKGEYN